MDFLLDFTGQLTNSCCVSGDLLPVGQVQGFPEDRRRGFESGQQRGHKLLDELHRLAGDQTSRHCRNVVVVVRVIDAVFDSDDATFGVNEEDSRRQERRNDSLLEHWLPLESPKRVSKQSARRADADRLVAVGGTGSGHVRHSDEPDLPVHVVTREPCKDSVPETASKDVGTHGVAAGEGVPGRDANRQLQL